MPTPAPFRVQRPASSLALSRRGFLRALGAAGAVGAASPLLAACGSDTASTTLKASASASPRGVTLRAMVNQPHRLAFTEVLAPAWKAATGGKLEVTAIPYDQLTTKQILDVQNDAGEFDVFDYFYFGLGALVDAGALVDLTDWIDGHPDVDPDDFLPTVYDPYTLVGDKRYGLPYDGDLHILFYNTEILDRFDLRPPKTWDDYDAVAKKVTSGGGGDVYGAIVQGQQVPVILGCSFVNRLAGYGGELLDKSGRPLLDSEEALAAAEHLVTVNEYALPTPLQVGFDQANTAFLSGQGAMIDTWTDMSLRADDPSLSKIKGKWGAVALPVGGDNTTPRTALEAGFGIGVSTASSHQAEAAEFVVFAASAKQNLAQARTPGSGIDPNRSSVLASAAYLDSTPLAGPVIRQSWKTSPVVWPRTPDAPKLMQNLVDQLALAIQGKQTAKESLATAQQSWEKALS